MNRIAAIIAVIYVSLAGAGVLKGGTPADTVSTEVLTVNIPAGADSVVTVTTTTTTTTTKVVTKVYKKASGQSPAELTSVQHVADSVAASRPMTSAASDISAPAVTAVPDEPKAVVYKDSINGRPVNEYGKIVLATIDPELLKEKVVVSGDTVPIILPAPNYGRYDRGLFNFLFIPKGQWLFGLSASYGEFNSDDVQVLSLIKDFNFKGKMYSVQPTVSYFFRSNQSMGLKFSYARGIADLGGISVDFDDDINFTLSDVSYYSQSYTASVFYRNYVGLGKDKRFAVFNEVDLSFGSGSSRFKRSYDGELMDTKTLTTKWSLNFSPGVTMFIMDYVCFNISFGVFGLHVTHDKQYTNGEDEGSRTSSGANFRFNLFNINFGLGVTI